MSKHRPCPSTSTSGETVVFGTVHLTVPNGVSVCFVWHCASFGARTCVSLFLLKNQLHCVCCNSKCLFLHLCPDTPQGLGDVSRVCNGSGPGVPCTVTALFQAPLPSETVVFCAFGGGWTRGGGRGRAALESAKWKEEVPPQPPPRVQPPPPPPPLPSTRKFFFGQSPPKKFPAPSAPLIFLCMYYINDSSVHGMCMCSCPFCFALSLCPQDAECLTDGSICSSSLVIIRVRVIINNHPEPTKSMCKKIVPAPSAPHMVGVMLPRRRVNLPPPPPSDPPPQPSNPPPPSSLLKQPWGGDSSTLTLTRNPTPTPNPNCPPPPLNSLPITPAPPPPLDQPLSGKSYRCTRRCAQLHTGVGKPSMDSA